MRDVAIELVLVLSSPSTIIGLLKEVVPISCTLLVFIVFFGTLIQATRLGGIIYDILNALATQLGKTHLKVAYLVNGKHSCGCRCSCGCCISKLDIILLKCLSAFNLITDIYFIGFLLSKLVRDYYRLLILRYECLALLVKDTGHLFLLVWIRIVIILLLLFSIVVLLFKRTKLVWLKAFNLPQILCNLLQRVLLLNLLCFIEGWLFHLTKHCR